MNFLNKTISAHKIRTIRDQEQFCSGEELAEWFGNVLPSIAIDGIMQDQTNPKGNVEILTELFYMFYIESISDLMIDFLGGTEKYEDE